MYVIDADRDGWTVLCSYSNGTGEAPHTIAENHGNISIDGMMFFFTANFTRVSKMQDSR